MKKIIAWLLPISLFIAGLTACEQDKNYSYYDELEEIDAFLLESGLDFVRTNSGLYYLETREGTGAMAARESYVTVNFQGMLLDSVIFSNSEESGPISFVVGYGDVVAGWEEAMTYMREGGTATIIVPSHLAYGSQSVSDEIGPYTSLVFDIELLDIR